jgi:hypothetical protein
MLFPESDSFSSYDKDMQNTVKEFYNCNSANNIRLWREQLIDSMFEAGDQGLWSGFLLSYPNMQKPIFNFNQLRRIKNMISGRQRQYRKRLTVIPSDNGADDNTATQISKCLSWNYRQESVNETFSEAFDQALVTGLSLLHVYMDFRDDPINGDLKTEALSYDCFMVDSLFRKKDFSDCRGVWKRTFLTPQEIQSFLPKSADSITGIDAGRDGKFNYMAETLYASTSRNKLTYDEYYYRDFRDATKIVDPVTGKQTEWTGTKELLREYISYFPQIQVLNVSKPTTKLALMVNGKLVYNDRLPSGTDSMPFVPVFGYFNPALSDYAWKVQGVIRALRDSTFLYNRINVILLDMLESKINSGWIYVDGKVVNPKDTYKSGQGQNIVLRPGAVIGQDIAPIVPSEIPASYFQVLEGLAKNPERISGVNEELLGSATDDKAGILGMLRQGAGLTTLQILFDQLDMSMRLCGGLQVENIEANWTPGKIEQIIGEKPAPHFYKEEFGRYDICVEEGEDTTTQRQQNFSYIMELKKVGITIPDSYLLKQLTIPNKNELIEAMQQQEQAMQQQAQQQAQLEMQEIQSRIKLADARAFADQGTGMERMSRIPENEAFARERDAAAIKDEETGFLDLIKSVKEIDSMDLGHLQQSIGLMDMIKQHLTPPLAVQPSASKTQTVPKKPTVKRTQPKAVKMKSSTVK